MMHSAFFESIKRREFERVYLFEGVEEYVKQKALDRLRSALLPDGLEPLNETLLDNPSASDILAAAETLPMMAEKRLVIVRDSALLMTGRARDEAEDSARLMEALPHMPETACVVYYCHGVSDGRKKLRQALGKQAAVVRFELLTDAELSQWMRATLKPLGKTITPQNAALLAFTSGHDLLVISHELEKLAALDLQGGEINAAHIEQIATHSLECTIFQLVDALVEGREVEAFRLLSRMLEAGESRIGILAMVSRQFRHLLHIKLMQADGKQMEEMQRLLGIPSFAMRRALVQANSFALKTLQKDVELCLETDYAIKSGRMRDDAALSRAIFLLCNR